MKPSPHSGCPIHAVSLFSLSTFFTHCYQDILYTSEVYWMGWMGKSVRDRRVEFVIRARRVAQI
jgi:hypothetical protein